MQVYIAGLMIEMTPAGHAIYAAEMQGYYEGLEERAAIQSEGRTSGRGWGDWNHTERAVFITCLNTPAAALDAAIAKRDARWRTAGSERRIFRKVVS